jgi:hypothetical protein
MTHPEFRQLLLHEHQIDIDRGVQRAYLNRRNAEAYTPAINNEPVVLRLCCVHDDSELDRLAVLEGRPAPKGRFVVAEVGGVVVAAHPLGGGDALADPFRPTAHLLPLLELRARQLGSERSRRSRLAAWGVVRSWSRA